MSIQVDAPLHWWRLELEHSHQEHVESLVAAFADPAHPDRAHPTREVAEQLAALAVRAAGPGRVDLADEPPEDVDVVPMAAWVLLEDPSILSPQCLAVMRVVRTETADAFEVLARFCEGAELDEDPEISTLGTPSGIAHAARVRTIETDDATRQVVEQGLVMWLRPDPGFCLTLSTATEDLVLGDRIWHALLLLAEGVEGV